MVDWFILAAIISMVVTVIAKMANMDLGYFESYFPWVLTFALWPLFIAIDFYEKLKDKSIPPKVITDSLQACQTKPLGSADIDREFYLKGMLSSRSMLEYQITGKDKSRIWTARCKVNEGNVRSIQLFSDTLCGDCLLQVTEEIPQQKYTVKERHTNIGSITVTNQHWEYYNLDHGMVCRATLETKAEEWDLALAFLSVVLLNPDDSPPTKTNYLIFHDDNGTTLGKYSIDLNNIDLTQDTDNRFDLRIAAVFAILADNSTVKNSA